MQVRLTKEGQKVLGFSPDRIIANVSDDRAFALMKGGYAAQDKGFMALFDGPLPEKPKPKPEPKKKKKPYQNRLLKEKRQLRKNHINRRPDKWVIHHPQENELRTWSQD